MWRVALVFAVVVTASCGGEEHDVTADAQPPDAEAPIFFPLRIVVTDGAVQAYLDAADLGQCGCDALEFPSPGQCSSVSDAGPCNGDPFCQSCITDFGVEVNGQRLTPTGAGGNDPWSALYGKFPEGQLSLVIAGCGHPTTRIPLDGPAFPQVTTSADIVNGLLHVSWTTDTPPLSTLVMRYEGYGAHLCNAEGSEYTFADGYKGQGTIVWPLGSRVDIATDFGPATVWRAGEAYAPAPN